MAITRTLPAAVLSVALALTLYAALWIGWGRDWTWLNGADSWALEPARDAAERLAWWVPLWNGLSVVFAPAVFRILLLIPVAVELRRHRYHVALFLAVSIWGSGLITMTAKHFADRTRPGTQLVDASGTSFPSGHALGVLVAVGALLVVYSHLARGHWRQTTITVGIVAILAIGVARVALNVHHPSDVIAGWALGYVWLMLCLWLVPPREPSGPGPDSAPTG